MSIHSVITDGYADMNIARVSEYGQLITAPYDYDTSVFAELAVVNTAYNFFAPKTGQRFVITVITGKANRNVSNTVDATVIVYEASASDTTVVDKVLFETAVIRGEPIRPPRLNLLVSAGKYVNAKTTDDDIFLTIMGYYIPKAECNVTLLLLLYKRKRGGGGIINVPGDGGGAGGRDLERIREIEEELLIILLVGKWKRRI